MFQKDSKSTVSIQKPPHLPTSDSRRVPHDHALSIMIFFELSGAHSSLHLQQPFAVGIPIVPWHEENHGK